MKRSDPLLAALVMIGVSLVAAFFVVRYREDRTGLSRKPHRNRTVSGPSAPESGISSETLDVLYRTIHLVQNSYLDTSRIDPQKMLLEAVHALETEIPMLLVTEQKGAVDIRIRENHRTFPLADIHNHWILLQRFSAIFEFIRTETTTETFDFRELQYAAINGMLRTLDPHTTLLTPDFYRSMKDRTQGNFGGLGIVISIRNGELTIISPITGTPAFRSGLRAGDVITRIDDASTINMPINDAVSMMRGQPGTTVTLQIRRESWSAERIVRLTRAEIKVRSMDSAVMAGNIGYIIIHDFQANTAQDLMTAMSDMFSDTAPAGLILDLRSNPGGLLTAAIRVADLFLRDGVIVTTAGQKLSERVVQKATPAGTLSDFPVVILMNSGSASASEIVAGALKYHHRAILIGERTFGKGSVQMLHEFEDQSALKMTTAQYLTPGDISIQSVGISPHVETLQMRVARDKIDLKTAFRYRETDLTDSFLPNIDSAPADSPDLQIRYLNPQKSETASLSEEDSAEEEPISQDDSIYNFKFDPDFEIDLAHSILKQMKRHKLTRYERETLSPVLDTIIHREQRKLISAMRKIGVDWSEASPPLPGQITAMIRILSQAQPLKADTEAELAVTVKNVGTTPIYRLLASSRSDFSPLDQKELAFGALKPGQTITRKLPFTIPPGTHSRTDDIRVSFEDMNDNEYSSLATRFSVQESDAPVFSCTARLLDNTGGNNDSIIQPGETVSLIATIQNSGSGPAQSVLSTLKNENGNDIFLLSGRSDIGQLQPGETRQARFEFQVRETFAEDSVKLKLSVIDTRMQIYSTDQLQFPVLPAVPTEPASDSVFIPAGTMILAWPAKDAPGVFKTTQDGTFQATVKTDSFYQIVTDSDPSGWISKSAISTTIPDHSGLDAETAVRQLLPLVNPPPKIILEPTATVTDLPSLHISGIVTDETQVQNVYIFQNNRKVFFTEGHSGRAVFHASLDLTPGLNYITIIAEETRDLQSRKTLLIRRDRKDGMPFIRKYDLKGTPEPLGVLPDQTTPSLSGEASP
jgi:carboxyl-terminal processing protease